MKDGFVKVGAGAPEIRPGDCEYNARSIIRMINEAYMLGVRVLTLPELCITGSTCGDLFLHSALLNGAQSALNLVTEASEPLDMIFTVGVPLRIGGALCNCAAVITKGEIVGIISKERLSTAEKRCFTSSGDSMRFICSDYPDLGFEVCIGSDIPKTNADIILRMSAEPEIIGKADKRRAALSVQTSELCCAEIFAGSGEGESTANAVYGGHRLIYENGKPVAQSGLFGCGLTTTDLDLGFIAYERRRRGIFPIPSELCEFTLSPGDTGLSREFRRQPFVPDDAKELEARCADIVQMQAAGLVKRIKHTFTKKLVIGVSGGLDSTLALIVCTKAAEYAGLAGTDVIAVTMPCFGTTSRTKSNAEKLCEQLGVTFREVNITKAVEQHFADISHDAGNMNSAYENAQARERTQVLMDIANDENGLVIGTGDLSELALGWATFGGDHLSMYGVNAGIPKTLIRRIVSYCADTYEYGDGNTALAAVLRDIVNTPISPELLPDQKTEDSVGPYELHDFFLYHTVRRGCSPSKLYRIAKTVFCDEYDKAVVLKWLRVFVKRFFSQQFKRSCSPDGIRIGPVSLSPADLNLPSDICSDLWIKEAMMLEP